MLHAAIVSNVKETLSIMPYTRFQWVGDSSRHIHR